MARLQAPCPACAAPVEFKSRSSLVTICPYCTSVVARGDKSLEDHGKVADIVDTQSPLKVGAKGRFRGKPFRLTGRVQYRHAAGGVWDEWYAEFPNNKWGWLAEAQGRFYLTFPRKVKEGGSVQPLESLAVGAKIKIGETEYSVAELGEGTNAGAEGEIPYDFTPNKTHTFADLYGPEGQFATIDYGDETPSGTMGWQVSLDEIGMADLKSVERDAKTVASKQVSCPQCGGALELRAPDETQRVACQYCSALLDCNHGNLEYLSTLTSRIKPLIELGATGTLFDVEYTLIGFMQRSVTFDRKYYWTEYLLYNPTVGFRWLIDADSHWSFAEPISPGDIHDHKTSAVWDGKTFKLFQRALAKVEYVMGEFYWKVEVGEEVAARDLICPPYSISVERSIAPGLTMPEEGKKGKKKLNLGEVNMTLATYVPHAVIESAFSVKELPRSWQVAPNQPTPVEGKLFMNWLMFAVAGFIVYFGAAAISANADGWLLV